MSSFKDLNLSEKMVEALQKIGYNAPSPIQELVIPSYLKRKSLVVTSQTGSGKTHSFLIPIIESIDVSKSLVQGIIIVPTRELAKQCYEFAREFLPFYPDLKIRLLSSEIAKNRNKDSLSSTPHLLIATPGRLVDLALNDTVINLLTAKYLVLDEADMLMEMGFFQDIDAIISKLKDPIIGVFSATINNKVAVLIKKYIQADNYIKLDNYTSKSVQHYAVDIRHKDIKSAVTSFINAHPCYLLLIFASKKEDVNSLYKYLKGQGTNVGVIHGDLSTRERKNMMKRINNDEFNIIVCSDMAARGIDFDNVTDVLNVDLPKDLSFYFHRAGRTGRFNNSGSCYTFYNNDDVEGINKLMEMKVNFNFLILKNDTLIEGKGVQEKSPRKVKRSIELDKEIKKAVAKNKYNEVKPMYKKKTKLAVKKVIKRHRDLEIKRKIREGKKRK